MANMIDYVLRERRPFGKDAAAAPFNEVDALVFAQMAYQRLGGIVPTLGEVERRYATTGAVVRARLGMFDWAHPLDSLRLLRVIPFDGPTLMDTAHHLPPEAFDVRTGFAGMGNPDRTAELFEAIAASPRFADIRVNAYEDHFDAASALQFAAQTYRLPDGTLVVAYRGTDDSLVGWREDFDMTYQWPVGAQRQAADYLRRVMRLWPDGDVLVTGHSKGGNLAVYAAMMACREPEADARVKAVYSLDGPGFLPEVIGGDSATLDHIRARVTKIVPEASIVGMIFETEPALASFRAVTTDGTGINRHFGFNWHVDVDGDTFEWTPLTDEARYWCRSFHDWAESMTLGERRRALDGISGVFHDAGHESLTTLMAAMPGALPGLLAAAGKLPAEDRAHIMLALRGLAKALIGNRAAALGGALKGGASGGAPGGVREAPDGGTGRGAGDPGGAVEAGHGAGGGDADGAASRPGGGKAHVLRLPWRWGRGRRG